MSIVALLLLGSLLAQQDVRAPSPADVARARAIYQPGAPHAELAKLAGTWAQDVTFASGTSFVKASGRVVNRLVLGGRFLHSEGEAANPPALDYQSMVTFGFDGRSQEYTVVVFDSFGTYYVEARQPLAAFTASGELRLVGTTPEGAATKRFEVVLSWLDENTYRVEIVFRLPDRPPVVAVSSLCRRISAGGARRP